VDGVFISIGEVPKSEIAKKAGVETDDYGYIKTDDMQRTNVRGIYADIGCQNPKHTYIKVGYFSGIFR